ncbi:MAG: sigma-54-dependent transcriptional regulator, partial [Planctomycetota bacterium]
MSDAADITVLIADDAPDIVRTVQARVKHAGFATITADNGKSALDALLGTTGIDADGKTPDIALIDINMPGMSGLEVLQAARVERPNLPVIVMTADITVPRVVEAMRGGAYDFLPKPIDPNVLQVTLRQASEHVRLQRRVSQLQEELGIYEGRVVAESAGMKRAMRLLRQAVDSNATVLL